MSAFLKNRVCAHLHLLKKSWIICGLLLLAGCNFISDSLTYKDKTRVFVASLMQGDYQQCLKQMALESEHGKDVEMESLIIGLEKFRTLLASNFGESFDYRFLKSEKKIAIGSMKATATPPNTTLAFIEFSNKKEFGVFQVLFDDHSKKIINIQTLDIKAPIPNMTQFWLMGLLPLSVLLLNIYVIRKIRKSTLKRKWLKYLSVILLNVPTISYAAISGFSMQLLNFEFLLGISFSLQGYYGSVWGFGIPLGGLFWLWRLRQYKDDFVYDQIIEASYIGTDVDEVAK